MASCNGGGRASSTALALVVQTRARGESVSLTRASTPLRRVVGRRACRRLGLFLVGVSALLLAFLVLSAWGERFLGRGSSARTRGRAAPLQFHPASFDLEAARARDLGEVVIAGAHVAQGICS